MAHNKANRRWLRGSIRIDGQLTGAHTITCARCADTFSLIDRHTKQLPFDIVEKRLREVGWFVGKRAKDDMCPKCLDASIIARRAKRSGAKPHLTLISTTEQEPMTAAPEPKKMTREDKRIINAKLHEVYVGDGYATPWTDLKVAQDLGCPVGWVRDVREELFGDDSGNAEVKEFLAKAQAAKDLADKALTEIAKKQAEIKRLVGECSTLEQSAKDARRQLEALNITAARIARAVNA